LTSPVAKHTVGGNSERSPHADPGHHSYPDIDGLHREQASELDAKKREASLRKIQQLMHEKAMFLPIWQFVLKQGVGPRVAEPGIGLITDYPWSAPYEDLRLKEK
jgi:peptide/nickel transport system substrate-binding protein